MILCLVRDIVLSYDCVIKSDCGFIWRGYIHMHSKRRLQRRIQQFSKVGSIPGSNRGFQPTIRLHSKTSIVKRGILSSGILSLGPQLILHACRHILHLLKVVWWVVAVQILLISSFPFILLYILILCWCASFFLFLNLFTFIYSRM